MRTAPLRNSASRASAVRQFAEHLVQCIGSFCKLALEAMIKGKLGYPLSHGTQHTWTGYQFLGEVDHPSLPTRYDSRFRRPRSTATPPSRSVKPLAADAGSISGALAAGDVQTPGFVLLPEDPQLKDCGGWN